MNQRETDILSLLPLVKHLAQRVVRSRGLNESFRDDLIQYGNEGAIKAVDDYDPGKGASLKTYAATRILGHMLDGMRKESGVRRSAGEIRRTRPQTVGLDIDAHDMADHSDPYEGVEIGETLRSILDRLPLGHRRLLLDHWVHQITMDDISILHGVTPSRISQIMKQALADAQLAASSPDVVIPERGWTARHERVSPYIEDSA